MTTDANDCFALKRIVDIVSISSQLKSITFYRTMDRKLCSEWPQRRSQFSLFCSGQPCIRIIERQTNTSFRYTIAVTDNLISFIAFEQRFFVFLH